ncbi:hypothetical protein ACWDUL_12030 [Nocardia niigatensis]|uniref:hypothetical protein n=1 Tax=Nocardia niigatensis TaxID=209249 RepID=UPI0003012CBD|nr:hypothetical protein [Nocardia niigatensis]
MNEDDSARREFVFGLFLTTIVTPLLAGLTTFAAILGGLTLYQAAARLLAARGAKPDRPTSPNPAGPRLRHTNHRHTRRALSTRRPGGVLH